MATSETVFHDGTHRVQPASLAGRGSDWGSHGHAIQLHREVARWLRDVGPRDLPRVHCRCEQIEVLPVHVHSDEPSSER